MPNSPYLGKNVDQWSEVTEELILKHIIKENEIVECVLSSWDAIFTSQIGGFYIGKDIHPTPQIISFFLHELIAHSLMLKYPTIFKVGTKKNEKDIHCLLDPTMSIEIKGSSNKDKIFANRSYAQEESANSDKPKNGYYIAINFQKFDSLSAIRPEILLIRFGYLEHSDWRAQASETGQQASLHSDANKYKLKILYKR